jgi:hypothetical protein
LKNVLLSSFFLFSISLLAQQPTIPENVATEQFQFSIEMDDVVIEAARTGFDVKDFVRMVQKDESFYLAFHNIRFMDYQSNNQIAMYDKKQQKKAAYHLVMQQKSNGECRTMSKQSEDISGDFMEGEDFRYYTAKMFDKAFLTHGTVCETEHKAFAEEDNPNAKGIDKHINELKKMIFKPGQKVDIPLIGNKLAIFSPEMQPFYTYSVQSKRFEDKTDCYVFIVEAKPEYQAKNKGETVIKYLETYFNKNNLQVVARNYTLKYQSLAFDFDVSIFIKLQKYGKKYVPSFLQYDGNWDVPLRARERSKFSSLFWGFE